MSVSKGPLLNYHDAVIYESDWNLLKSSTEWLNDACIHFYLTWLNQERKAKVTDHDDNEKMISITCLDPCVVSYVMHQLSHGDEDEIQTLKKEWTCDNHNYFLCVPINDHHGASSWIQFDYAQGTHWSLLVVGVIATPLIQSDNESNVYFYHLDSSSGMNRKASKKVARKLNDILCNQNGSDRSIPNVVECNNIPQQTNSYDCGIYTCAMADGIMNYFDSTGKADTNIFKHQIEFAVDRYLQTEWSNHQQMAKGLRTKICNLIAELKK